MRYLTMAFFMISIFLISCFGNDTDKSPQDIPRVIGDVKLYTFSSDDEYFLSNAQPFILPPETTLRDALNSLGRHLSETYFSKTFLRISV